MDCFVAYAPRNDGNLFCTAAIFRPKTRSKRPLLTGNGLSPGFSLYVRLAYKASGAVQGARVPQKERGRGYMHKLILAAASVAALVGAVVFAGPASAQAPIIIKFSHVVASNTPKGAAAEKFKELAEKYTAGKVKVEVYPNSTLYKDKEELEALQLGAVQMLAPSNSKFGPIGVREFEVFDLPYILPDLATLRKVTDGPLGAKLLKKLDPKGMTGLAYWDNGFKEMTANKKLITPADYKGVKFRIQSSKVLEAQFRSLGAIPQVMAFGEVYQALQTGVVDGQENTTSNVYSQKMHEVQKYMTMTNHGYIGYVVVVNKKFWDGLPADIREQLEKAMKEATAYGNNQSAKENDDALAEIVKSGKTEIIKLTPEQDKAMREAMEPVYKDVATRVGQPLIDEFVKETGGVSH
jgi:C4-dicarboxylate-binding protein DctP